MNNLEEIKKEYSVETWFFLFYNLESPHVRIRFKCFDGGNTSGLINKLNQIINNFNNENVIHKVSISKYDREIFRYSQNCISFVERIFYHDSNLALNLIQKYNDSEELWIYGIISIHCYFNDLDFDLNVRIKFLNNLSQKFLSEFGLNKSDFKRVNRIYNREKEKIIKYMNGDFNEITLFLTRSKETKPLIQEIYKISSENPSVNLHQISFGILHMSLNRLFDFSGRKYEFLIYTLLERYYLTNLNRKSNQLIKK